MKNETGRAIIIYDNKLVTIKRTKYNENMEVKSEYYTIPGGHLENGENFEDATIRELYEELGVNVELKELYMEIDNQDLDRLEHFYIAEITDGVIGTGNGPEFQNVDYLKYGKYEIEYLSLNELEKYNLLPMELKKNLIQNKSKFQK